MVADRGGQGKRGKSAVILTLERGVAKVPASQRGLFILRNVVDWNCGLAGDQFGDVLGNALRESGCREIQVLAIVERDHCLIPGRIEQGLRGIASGAAPMAVGAGLHIVKPRQSYFEFAIELDVRAELVVQSDRGRQRCRR